MNEKEQPIALLNMITGYEALQQDEMLAISTKIIYGLVQTDYKVEKCEELQLNQKAGFCCKLKLINPLEKKTYNKHTLYTQSFTLNVFKTEELTWYSNQEKVKETFFNIEFSTNGQKKKYRGRKLYDVNNFYPVSKKLSDIETFDFNKFLNDYITDLYWEEL